MPLMHDLTRLQSRYLLGLQSSQGSNGQGFLSRITSRFINMATDWSENIHCQVHSHDCGEASDPTWMSSGGISSTQCGLLLRAPQQGKTRGCSPQNEVSEREKETQRQTERDRDREGKMEVLVFL